MTTIALVHGPNLNMLGRRPSQHYGTLTLPELEAQVRAWGDERGMRVGTFQTNHEGAFLEHVHGLAGAVDGAIVNPGALVALTAPPVEPRPPSRKNPPTTRIATTPISCPQEGSNPRRRRRRRAGGFRVRTAS